ncbi:MAG TPA: tyrosine--tRNA ligase [Candidatus Paceibacterota bacterium]|nr:tyrosine--tRNA ligase [Candidatus Paceibacterota bacterium]
MEISKAKTEELISRGTSEVIEYDHLKKRILAGEKLRIKFGIDPTTPDIHLGHTVSLFKLKQFQDLGHKIVLIIGDFTAMIGDPSGRSEERKTLTEREVKTNLKTYLDQAGKIINIKKTEVHHNSKWFKKEGLKAILTLARTETINQALKREDFQKRLAANKNLSLLEVLYPLFQGYDSVKVKADVEIGGEDQKLNLLMGRRILRQFNQPEQDILTTPLLIGLDGVRKMSKSYGNHIALQEKPEEMFGKLMSLPDSLVGDYFKLLTKLPKEEIEKLSKELPPRDLKVKLAATIVGEIHGLSKGDKAAKNFNAVFQKHEIPKDAPIAKAKIDELLIEVIVRAGLVSSRNEIKRLIAEGAVSDFKKGKISDYHYRLREPLDLRIGKHRFLRIFID